MNRIADVRGDIQLESSGWLFKSPHAGGRGEGILCRPHYRSHSIFGKKNSRICPQSCDIPRL